MKFLNKLKKDWWALSEKDKDRILYEVYVVTSLGVLFIFALAMTGPLP